MRLDRIEEGDTVLVEFVDGDDLTGVVLYTPAMTGDSWSLRSSQGILFYVQMYETMRLLKKGVPR